MSRMCSVCGKTSLNANKVSFSNKRHAYLQVPNLQSVKTNINGTVKRVKVCTSCIKGNKIQRAV